MVADRPGLPLVSGKVVEPQRQIELAGSSLGNYLARWVHANSVFGDDVKLASLILWPEGFLSVGITQPQYHGRKATESEIMEYFMKNGGKDVTRRAGRAAFYHRDLNLLAVDAEPRNCFINADGLFPFDVVLAETDPCLHEMIHRR